MLINMLVIFIAYVQQKCEVYIVFLSFLPFLSFSCNYMFKHNTYKYIQPGISEKNKDMLSIPASLENS